MPIKWVNGTVLGMMPYQKLPYVIRPEGLFLPAAVNGRHAWIA